MQADDVDAAHRAWSSRGAKVARAAVLAAALAALVVGFRAFLFLTDDAYIEFRYAANAMAGRGLVWNPAPFAPVEGYTSFLWVVVLWLVWAVTGAPPTETAAPLSLLFGAGTLLLAYRFVGRMRLPAPLARFRLALVVLVLAGTLSNRTFLAWLSSGLETALFNFCFTLWLYVALTREDERGPAWGARLSAAAALVALTRPDGLLAVAGTVALVGLVYGRRRRVVAGLVALAPLLAVALHLVWRRLTYGDWLPNTYYAKHVRPWPESGARYLASFVLEYGVWVWAAVLLAWLGKRLAGWKRAPVPPREVVGGRLEAAIPIAVVVAHFAYYTFVIGGDHFEYRIYSVLVPLLFASMAWLASRVAVRPAAACGLVLAFVAAAQPIPWVHWDETRGLTSRAETHVMIRPIADRFPAWARPVVAAWDELQAWLISHHVCMRHQEHKVFEEYTLRLVPSRAEGARIPWSGRPVFATGTVGIVGWVLPNVAVIDTFGLNDRVIARAPARSDDNANRRMAHDRRPPPGYVACFAPNVRIRDHRATVRPRRVPLTDDAIRACESRRW